MRSSLSAAPSVDSYCDGPTHMLTLCLKSLLVFIRMRQVYIRIATCGYQNFEPGMREKETDTNAAESRANAPMCFVRTTPLSKKMSPPQSARPRVSPLWSPLWQGPCARAIMNVRAIIITCANALSSDT